MPPEKISEHSYYIIPSFLDAQVYGARMKLFAVYPTPDTLHEMYEEFKEQGTTYFLPTVATNTSETIYNCIDAIHAYWQGGGKGVGGLHLEGPYINPTRRGAHIKELIRFPEYSEIKKLLEFARGAIKMITLAPELCSKEIIQLIQNNGIVISAGHSNATYEQCIHAFNNGINTVTHLYNAMSPFHHREPGMVGAVFQHPAVKASIIADGLHVDFAALKIAKELMGDRLFLITDAVTETNEGFYQHTREGDKFSSAGILSGSSLSMLKAVKNCAEFADIDLRECFRMASLYPAQMLGINRGLIAEGMPADLIMLNEMFEINREK